jgi:phenylacetate-CoA ligase
MHDARNYYEPVEVASRPEIGILQAERLRAILERVYARVPAYKKKFDAAGVKPSDFRTLDDLAKFPFTTKADLRENYPFGLFAVPREEIMRVHASSGTTGKSTVVGYTKNDIDVWANILARNLYGAGVRPGMLVHIAFGYGLFTGGLGWHYGVERLGCTVVPVSGGMTERQVQLILDFRPDVLLATPSYLLVILDEFRKRGIDPKKTSLKLAICGAEPWTDAMRAEIEGAFSIQALDTYGLSEVIGPGVSSECIETKDGLHIWEDHFYPEIIDPITGEVLPDGQAGELVFTSLTKEGMPVVRYRTRDLSRLLPGTARTMRRMEKVTGRTDDMIIIRGVNVFPSQIEEQLLRCPGLSPHYQIELRREGRLDLVKLLVEARPGAADDITRRLAGQQLAAHIRNNIGISIDVDVGEPGSVERSVGKAKRVIDLRAKS